MQKVKNKRLLNVGVFVLGVVASLNVLADHPKNFICRNYTPYQSKAKIRGMWVPLPTAPAPAPGSYSERVVPWVGLRVYCLFSNECAAKLYMKTDTSNPIFVGEGTLNLTTGEMTPAFTSNNGFTLTSTEPGMIEIREVAPVPVPEPAPEPVPVPSFGAEVEDAQKDDQEDMQENLGFTE